MARPRAPRRPALVATLSALALASCAGLPSSSPPPTLGNATPAPSRSAIPSPTRVASTASPAAPASAPPSPSKSPSRAPSCAALASRLSVTAQVGQLLMVAVSSTRPSAAETKTVSDVRAGSVILLGNSTLGVAGTRRLVDHVRDAADPPSGVATLVAADQEGGLVQRLQGPGFATVPSARVQSTWSDKKLAAKAKTWGSQLAKAGIDANLAPVADVVPDKMVQVNQPIGRLRRGYGSSPTMVASKVSAFHRGMRASGVATAAKHFPGLGRVRGNTDFAARVADSATSRHDAGLAGFQDLVDARIEMVMVASATYTRIDRRSRAVFSPDVISEMLRGDLGFSGVVISDDLSAAALGDVAPGDRAIRFVEAGGDLAIVGDPGEARTIATALAARAKRDQRFGRRVAESAARVVAMKARSGQASCLAG